MGKFKFPSAYTILFFLIAVVAVLSWVGQVTTAPFEIQGNESLGEVRLGAVVGRRQWVRLEVVRATEPNSPDWGGLLSVGVRY